MQMQISIPQVPKEETERFAKVWTYNGIAVNLDSTTIQFATDWANMLLRSIFTQMANDAAKQAQAAQVPLVIGE